MKILIQLFFLSAFQLTAFAQADNTFRFVDLQGQEVPDGAEITVTDLTLDDWDAEMMVVPLMVENQSGEKAAAALYEVIDDMPNGMWQTCALGNCKELSQTGYSNKSIVDAHDTRPIDTEWFPTGGDYPEWTATLQIQVFNIVEESKWGVVTQAPGDEVIGYGPTVKVHFAYGMPTGITLSPIGGVGGGTSPIVYNASGQRITTMQRSGINIIRMADGRVIKLKAN